MIRDGINRILIEYILGIFWFRNHFQLTKSEKEVTVQQ